MLSAVDKENPPLAVIYGMSGTSLTADERAFFKEVNPLGYILFARNCEKPEQIKALIQSLHELAGREVPVLIDQEGGRVQRLAPPLWPQYPTARSMGDIFRKNFQKGRDAVRDTNRAIALDLRDLGINVNCAPVMDVLTPDTHDIIGDRAFCNDAEVVAALAGEVCRTYSESGIIPIIKHIPGHGRATSDSHLELPVVNASLEELDKTDFVPFREMQRRPYSEACWAMTAHVIYTAIDDAAPATCSRKVIYDIIRERLGFSGLLVSDDLSMEALAMYGGLDYRAEKVLRSGCDIALHCNGKMEEMVLVAKRSTPMTERAVKAHNKSAAWIKRNFK